MRHKTKVVTSILCRDAITSEKHFLCTSRSHFHLMAEILHATDTHSDCHVLKYGIFCCNDDITRPTEHEATSNTLALHRTDCWLGCIPPPLCHVFVDFSLAIEKPFGGVLTILASKFGR